MSTAYTILIFIVIIGLFSLFAWFKHISVTKINKKIEEIKENFDEINRRVAETPINKMAIHELNNIGGLVRKVKNGEFSGTASGVYSNTIITLPGRDRMLHHVNQIEREVELAKKALNDNSNKFQTPSSSASQTSGLR